MEAHVTGGYSANATQSTLNNRQRHFSKLPTSTFKAAQDQNIPRVTSSTQRASKRPSSRQNSLSQWARLKWEIPLLFLILILSLYTLNPTESNIVYPLIFLSYKLDDASTISEYGKGPRDIALVAFYTLVLFFAREFIMHEIIRPLAKYLGITSPSKLARFNEQVYVAIYTGIIGPLGMYVMYHSPTWYFSTTGLYAGYPHRTHPAVAKFYYLLQAAFWVQQALVMVLGLEKRRRDFRELVMHHIVTVSLIALSYRFHFTMMGVLVYVTHDISDFFLATSKSLNYIDSPLQAPYYVICIATWVYLRHYINLKILFSILTEFRTVGPYVLDWEAGLYKSDISRVITFTLLAALQMLNLFWLYCLLRNGYRFVVFGIAKDDREEEDDLEDDQQNAAVEGVKRMQQ